MKFLKDGKFQYQPEGLYTIFDRVAEEAGPTFNAVNDGIALRNFQNLMEKVPPIQKQEYRLYKVGTFNIHNMILTVVSPPEEILFTGEENNGK